MWHLAGGVLWLRHFDRLSFVFILHPGMTLPSEVSPLLSVFLLTMCNFSGPIPEVAPDMCKTLQESHLRHLEYSGQVSISENGLVCQDWASNSITEYDSYPTHY